MNHLLKWTLMIATMMLLIQSGHAWNIGGKGRVNGPQIHSTYFLTPNNAPFPVRAQAYAGNYVNGACVYNAVYDLGTPETLASGDTYDIDASLLKNVIGNGYSCVSIYYYSKQLVIDTFQLVTDGLNYVSTFPATTRVTIL